MDEQEPKAESEGGIGQSASTAGLARRIVSHWNQAVKETGDGTYPIIIAKFAERIAFDEREACAKVCEETANTHGWNYDSPSMGREMAHKIRTRSNVPSDRLAEDKGKE